jgi:hypothetical protein
MREVKYGLEISPILGMSKCSCFCLSWRLTESPRVVNQFSFLLFDHMVLYGCTVVQDQCSIVALYCCITSLPVIPSTTHGHCIVVLDTSKISILHCTRLKAYTVYYRCHLCSTDPTMDFSHCGSCCLCPSVNATSEPLLVWILMKLKVHWNLMNFDVVMVPVHYVSTLTSTSWQHTLQILFTGVTFVLKLQAIDCL